MADALKALRDWAGLTQLALAKRAGISDSTISSREQGHGPPSSTFLDTFVTTCLHHRGVTPQEILTELRYWQQTRTALDRKRRNPAAPVPPQQPAPVPAARDDNTQQAAKATNGADSPDPASDPAPNVAPEGAWRRWAALTPRWRWAIGGTAATVVAAVIVGVLGLPGPHTASGADRQPSSRAGAHTQPLVHSPPYVPGQTYTETVRSAAGARTYRNPSGMAGEGDRIPNHTTVHVTCKIVAPGAASIGTYWYRITDPPWKNYYSPTNSFLNDDPISGTHTKEVDESVPYCPP